MNFNQAMQPQLNNLSKAALADYNNGKMSDELRNSLYLTCHMYFINN